MRPQDAAAPPNELCYHLGMNIVVISGSTRADSASLKVSNYLVQKLNGNGIETNLVDLNESRLPLYDDGPSKSDETWLKVLPLLTKADAYIFVSPEWDGMFSVGLHNLLNYTASAVDDKPLAHKPVMLVGVSSGMGGAYPLAQMKAMGQKNNHFVVIPDNLRFAKFKEVFVDGELAEGGLKARVEYSLKLLAEYAEALKSVRSSSSLDLDTFASGV